MQILTSPRDPRGLGGEVRAVELSRKGDTIALRVAKAQDYGDTPHHGLVGLNWFHRSMSVLLDPATARWLASELNGLAAAIDDGQPDWPVDHAEGE